MELHYLRFFPLVFWAVGMIFVSCLNGHWRQMDGRKDTVEKEGVAGAKLWVLGCVAFFLIGLFT